MPSGIPSIRYMGLLFHAVQPMAAGVRTAGPSRLRLVRDRRRAAINGRALVIASTTIYSGITGERGAIMFRVYLIVYMFLKDRSGHIVDSYSKCVIDCLRIDDPMEVAQLFHMVPNDSVMKVYDENYNSYRFVKGELINSEEDSDIDLFIQKYV